MILHQKARKQSFLCEEKASFRRGAPRHTHTQPLRDMNTNTAMHCNNSKSTRHHHPYSQPPHDHDHTANHVTTNTNSNTHSNSNSNSNMYTTATQYQSPSHTNTNINSNSNHDRSHHAAIHQPVHDDTADDEKKLKNVITETLNRLRPTKERGKGVDSMQIDEAAHAELATYTHGKHTMIRVSSTSTSCWPSSCSFSLRQIQQSNGKLFSQRNKSSKHPLRIFKMSSNGDRELVTMITFHKYGRDQFPKLFQPTPKIDGLWLSMRANPVEVINAPRNIRIVISIPTATKTEQEENAAAYGYHHEMHGGDGDGYLLPSIVISASPWRRHDTFCRDAILCELDTTDCCGVRQIQI